MSEAPPPIDVDEEALLGRLAQLDLAFAEHVHAQALATSDPDTINGLGRTYQRIARSLRQTLVWRSKLKQAREKAAAERPVPRDEDRIARRTGELRTAVKRVIYAELEVEHLETADGVVSVRDFKREHLEDFLAELSVDDAFGVEPLDAHVRALCQRLRLSPALAATWRELPDPPWADDPTPRWDADDEDDTS